MCGSGLLSSDRIAHHAYTHTNIKEAGGAKGGRRPKQKTGRQKERGHREEIRKQKRRERIKINREVQVMQITVRITVD